MKLSHSVWFYHRWDVEKKKKILTPLYNSITFLEDQKFTTNSFQFSITAALMTYFTKVFIFDRFVFYPLPASHLCTEAFCRDDFFEMSPQNHIDRMFGNFMEGNEKLDAVRRIFPPRQFPHKILRHLIWLTVVWATGGLLPLVWPSNSFTSSSSTFSSLNKINPRSFTQLVHLLLYLYLINL